MTRLIRTEWLKLATTRGPWAVIAGVLALLVACSHLPQTGGSIWWTKSAAVFAVKAF